MLTTLKHVKLFQVGKFPCHSCHKQGLLIAKICHVRSITVHERVKKQNHVKKDQTLIFFREIAKIASFGLMFNAQTRCYLVSGCISILP